MISGQRPHKQTNQSTLAAPVSQKNNHVYKSENERMKRLNGVQTAGDVLKEIELKCA